jgi:HEAT repeat protein
MHPDLHQSLQRRIRMLVDALGSAAEVERRAARADLAEIGRDAVAPLIETLQCGNERARWEAAFTLWKIGAEAANAVSSLSHTLRDTDDFILRGMVGKALGAIGPPAADAVPHLIHFLGDPIPLVSRSAAKALGQIRDLRAISALELASTLSPSYVGAERMT